MKTETTRKARLEAWLVGVWYGSQKPGLLPRAGLNMLSLVYGLLRRLSRQNDKCMQSKLRPGKKPVVLVVGNLIAGGAGKTPVVMAACQHLQQRGISVGLISRGYGRHGTAPQVFDPSLEHVQSREAGDEPAFLANATGCPIAVDVNRQAAAQALQTKYPGLQVIVSDDGLQHHRLQRHLEWVVFDSRAQGNGKLLPAGPLREPLNRLAQADAILANGLRVEELGEKLGLTPDERWHAIEVSIKSFSNGHGQTLSIDEATSTWAGQTTVAFTGIANPEKLFSALCALGLNCSQTIALPDHFDYPADYAQQFADAVLITTGKDAVKLNASNPRLWVAQIEVKLPAALTKSLEDCIGLTTD